MLLQLIISGILIGTVYSLIAIGLSLIFGVMNLTNFAHGDFLMLSMYFSYSLFLGLGLSPLASLPIVTIGMFIFGVLIYKGIISNVLKATRVSQMFTTYAIGLLLRGVIQYIFGIQYLSVNLPISTESFNIGNLVFSTPEIYAGIGAILATIALILFMKKTKIGLALVATSQNKVAASTMGVNTENMFMIAMAIGTASVGLAGGLLTNYYYLYPSVGAIFGLISLVTVALGGFGSINGAFFAGILIGLVQALGGFYLPSAYKLGLISLLFLVVISIRPQGLMGDIS